MNLSPDVEEELFLKFSKEYEDMIIDNEAEAMLYNDNQAFYVRPYANIVVWNKCLDPSYMKPLVSESQYNIPECVVMRKQKEGSRVEHL